MDKFSFLGNSNIDWIEEQYQNYKKDPHSVEPGWAHFFEGFEFAKEDYTDGTEVPENVQKEFKVLWLIEAYRSRGHLFTKTNPVRERRKYEPTLALENFGLSDRDLDTTFQAGTEVGLGPAPLREILDHLNLTYCQSIGIEYNYIRDPERKKWIREHIEVKNRPVFNKETKLAIFDIVNRATLFEQFLQRKFVGQKRFSVEGAEAAVAGLHMLVQKGAGFGLKEVVVGMAHRGRLNVLANIFRKKFEDIFSEFEGKEYEDLNGREFDGDVKYHLGYKTKVKADEGDVDLILCPNPSHLEAVDPVVEGIARSRIDNTSKDEKSVLPVLIHGDAAISGQGVVYEVIQMAQLDGYRTGGTIHLVINNQVGFTTNYLDGRSSTYCTDVAKTTLCPVFHVNGDDIDAMIQTVLIALEYRQKYHQDVFIDVLCYRKYGHNEGDEPKFTQPKLYDIIANHPSPREIYVKQLIKEGVIDQAYADKAQADFEGLLEEKFDLAKSIPNVYVDHFLADIWKGITYSTPEDFDNSPETGVDREKLVNLAKQINTLPGGKKFFRKIAKLMQDRLKMIEADTLDWAMGETLAYATLLQEGFGVRISGQDVERGTFSHRHAVIKTVDNEEEYVPLQHLSKEQGDFNIYNSLLSEYGVLGFDLGYAFASPNHLTIWEAQFGDFNNGAQIIIDQFLSSSEDKWRSTSGMVLLLPHGYEGMGSEHSSGRIERYLTLCAEYNMQVCNPTTPANFFHLLRRQLHRPFRKPLVVFTPKKLLRYPKCVSTFADMASGKFEELFDDPAAKVENIDTLVFCTGKIYYDILEEKERTESGDNIAVIRLEQIYPLPKKKMDAIIDKYKNATNYLWVQEEPRNMGAWGHILMTYETVKLKVISRNPSGSPAAGSTKVYQIRQRELMNNLFSYAKQPVK